MDRKDQQRSAVPPSPAAARRRAIGGIVVERGAVGVADIAREIGVSEMTVRRDLDALAREGVVHRSHGGAVPAGAAILPAEPSFAARRTLHTQAKRLIARAGSALIGQNEVVGLDVGSTVAALAATLRDRADLSLVTNSLQAVLALSGEVRPEIHVLGGQLRPREGSLCGQIAGRQLADHWLTRLFIGVAGIEADGLYDYAPAETEVKCAMMEHASEILVLADCSKFGRRSFVRFAGFERIAAIITDAEPPARIRDAITRAGSRLIVAGGTADHLLRSA